MKKEVFLAISIGFALGLVITFGIWTANKSLASIKNSSNSPTPTAVQTANATPAPNVTQAPTNTGALILNNPADETFSNKSSVTVSGKATAGATVVILFEGDNTLLLADAKGDFSTDVTLIPGYNSITVTAVDTAGVSSTQNVIVTYSTAKI